MLLPENVPVLVQAGISAVVSIENFAFSGKAFVRKADDIIVGTFNMVNVLTEGTLDAICSGLVEGFAGRDIGFDVIICVVFTVDIGNLAENSSCRHAA
jgi:hypothetical protein